MNPRRPARIEHVAERLAGGRRLGEQMREPVVEHHAVRAAGGRRPRAGGGPPAGLDQPPRVDSTRAASGRSPAGRTRSAPACSRKGRAGSNPSKWANRSGRPSTVNRAARCRSRRRSCRFQWLTARAGVCQRATPAKPLGARSATVERSRSVDRRAAWADAAAARVAAHQSRTAPRPPGPCAPRPARRRPPRGAARCAAATVVGSSPSTRASSATQRSRAPREHGSSGACTSTAASRKTERVVARDRTAEQVRLAARAGLPSAARPEQLLRDVRAPRAAGPRTARRPNVVIAAQREDRQRRARDGARRGPARARAPWAERAACAIVQNLTPSSPRPRTRSRGSGRPRRARAERMEDVGRAKPPAGRAQHTSGTGGAGGSGRPRRSSAHAARAGSRSRRRTCRRGAAARATSLQEARELAVGDVLDHLRGEDRSELAVGSSSLQILVCCRRASTS